MSNGSNRKRGLLIAGVALLVCGVGAFATWYKMDRVVPQPEPMISTQRANFLYGSMGDEKTAGIPYWIWLVLPRIFPEYLPGPGGYASLGFSWEETIEMPAGFAKQTVGYVRVAGNCAICHASSKSNGPDAAPTVFAAGPGHTAEVQKLLKFYQQCAQDPRFNVDNILDEISMATKLSCADALIYRYVLIPDTRKRILEQQPVIVDSAMWRHAENPASDGAYLQKMRALEPGLQDAEKAELAKYLATFPTTGTHP
jgi:hypothetical protein